MYVFFLDSIFLRMLTYNIIKNLMGVSCHPFFMFFVIFYVGYEKVKNAAFSKKNEYNWP
jgi:hypothetical protein